MSFGVTRECNGLPIDWNTKGVDAARVEVDAARVDLSADKYKGMGGLHFRSGKQGKPNVKSTVKTAMAKGTKKEFIGQVCYVKAQPEHTIAEAFLNWMKCLLNWMK